MIRDLITELAGIIAPSGSERELQGTLLGHVASAADESYIDVLGNGIARKHGRGPHVMLIAHADEPGLMVTDIDQAGFLRVTPIGSLTAHQCLGRQIQFDNGVSGISGMESGVKVSEARILH